MVNVKLKDVKWDIFYRRDEYISALDFVRLWYIIQDLVMNAVSRREFGLVPDLLLHTTQTPFSLSLI